MQKAKSAVKNRANDIRGTDIEKSNGMKQPIPPAVVNPDERWVKKYIEQFGRSPSFF